MQAGKAIPLTLDSAIQDRAEKVLAEVGQAFSPQGRDGAGDGPAPAS